MFIYLSSKSLFPTLLHQYKLHSLQPPTAAPADTHSLSGHIPDIDPDINATGLYERMTADGSLHTQLNPPITYTYKFPLKQVTACFFNRSVAELNSQDILAAKVIGEHVDPQSGTIYRQRRMLIKNIAPVMFRWLLGSANTIEFEEHSTTERNGRLTIDSHNLTYSRIILGVEHSTFEAHPANPQWTTFTQRGGMSATSAFGPLRGRIEKFVHVRMEAEGWKAVERLNAMLEKQQAGEIAPSKPVDQPFVG